MCLHVGLSVQVMYIFDFWRVRVIGVCAFSQVSGPDWGPNATYLSPSGLENLNYCTFSSQKQVWFDLQLRPLSVQFNISAFSQTAGNTLVCQKKFDFNFHVHNY